MPPEGPKKRWNADDKQIKWSEEAGLAAVAGFVEEQAVVGGFPEIDEVAEGDAAVHVGAADQADALGEALDAGVPLFSSHEQAEKQPDQILGKLPNLQEDGGEEVHITRTR